MKRGTDNNLFWTLFLLRTFSISLFFIFIYTQKYTSEQLVGIFSAVPLKNSKPKNGILHMEKSQTITLGVR